MKKKLLATLLTAVMAVSLLAGCSTPGGGGGSDDGGDGANGKVFRYATNTLPTTLDPNKITSIGDNEIMHAVTEGLTRNTAGEVTPGVAEEWEVSEDGLTYTFHLRDAKWSDGEPITAADFEYSWKRLADPATGSVLGYFVGHVKNGDAVLAGDKPVDELGIKAIDDKTLEVTLEHVAPFFLGLIGASGEFAPVRQDIVEEYGTEFAATWEKNVYSGPFKMTKSEDNEWHFEKNENYWDADSIKLDKCELTYVENTDTQVSMYEAGDLDYVQVPTAQVEKYKDQATEFVNGNVDYCYINPEADNPVMGNQNFRLALNYAIDRVEYNQLANSGVYQPYNGFVFFGLTAKDSTYGEEYDLNSYGYPLEGDSAKAKEYLEAAMKELNISDASDIEIEFTTTDAESNKKIAEVLQERWQNELGIKVKIRQVTYNEIYGEVFPKYDYEIGYGGWGADYDDAATYLEVFANKAYSPYNNPEFMELYDNSWLEADADARMDMLNQAEQILFNDGALVPLQARTIYYLLDEDTTGVNFFHCSVNIDWVYADVAE